MSDKEFVVNLTYEKAFRDLGFDLTFQSPSLADGGMFKAVFLSSDCGYLNALKLKKMFSSNIENLFSTKFLFKKPSYGFDNYPDIAAAINMYKQYFRK